MPTSSNGRAEAPSRVQTVLNLFTKGPKNEKDDQAAKEGGQSGETSSRSKDENPFVARERERRDLLFAAYRTAYQWMVVGLVLGLALLASSAGHLYHTLTSEVQTKIIVYDGKGQMLYAGSGSSEAAVPDAAVQQHLRGVLQGLRNVYTDSRATRDDYLRAYEFILQSSQAETFLRNYYEREGSPIDLVGDFQRAVVELDVGQIAGTRSWDVSWVEQTVKGGRVEESTWRGSFSVQRLSPSSRGTEDNPAAVFVDGMTWRQASTRFLSPDEASALIAPAAPGSGGAGSRGSR